MKKILLTSTALATMAFAPAIAFANSNAGSTLWIGVQTADGNTTPQSQETDLNQTQYEALFWTEIKGVGNHGETGSSTNILTYDTWDTDVIQKAKGMTDAGSPDIELARTAADDGQIALRAAAASNNNFVFKVIRNDAPQGGTPTIIYNRGLVVGPKRPNGRNEDFDLEVFTLALQQKEIVDDAAA